MHVTPGTQVVKILRAQQKTDLSGCGFQKDTGQRGLLLGGPARRLAEHELRELSPKTVQPNPTLSLPRSTLAEKNSGSFSPPRTLPQSPWLSEAAQVQALQRPASQQMSLAGISLPNERSSRARKRSSSSKSFQEKKKATKSKSSWNLFQRSKNGSSTETLPEPTGDTAVEAAPSYFTQEPTEPPKALTPPEEKEEHEANGRLRSLLKWFSKVPENCEGTRSAPPIIRTSGSTFDTIAPNSAISPAGGSDGCRKHEGKNFLPARNRCKLTDLSEEPECGVTASYPANEAVPVATPPIKIPAGGRPRSLFDNKNPPPTDDSVSSSTSSARVVPRVFSYRQGANAERREWWDAPKALVRRDPVKGISFFEFDMPEHLPSSPMCPANPMNKLRGKGVCVFHGRAKQTSMDEEAGIAEEDMMEST